MIKWYKRTAADSKVLEYQRAFLIRLCRENFSVKLYWYDGTSSCTKPGCGPPGNDSEAAFYDYADYVKMNKSYKKISEAEALAMLL